MNAFIVFVFAVIVGIAVGAGDSGGPCVNGLCGTGYDCGADDLCYAEDTCVDKLNAQGVNECPSKAYLCNNSIYRDLMTQECPKTCDRCNAAAPPTCADKLNAQGINECPSKAYLCNNSLYRDLMTQECPKTCNRCPN